MTYTIRIVRPRQFIEPGLGMSTYLDFGARLSATQWPPYGAHILQGLLSKKVPDHLILLLLIPLLSHPCLHVWIYAAHTMHILNWLVSLYVLVGQV